MKPDYDDIAGLYDHLFDSMTVRKKEFQWLSCHAGFDKNKTVLDIGCGNGTLLRTIAGTIKKGTGIDISGEMLARAKKNLSGITNIELLHSDSSQIPLPDKSIDIILSFFSFRYLDTDVTLKEILRILKPDGTIVIVDMFRNNPSIGSAIRILKDKPGNSLNFLMRPVKNRQLRRLVSHPAWRTMLEKHPLKSFGRFRKKMTSLFPFASYRVLDSGLKARTIGFSASLPLLFANMPEKVVPKLCIIDWGIGGMGFFSLFRKKHPGLPVLYFSDTGFTPYGKATKKALLRRLDMIIRFCSFNGMTHLIIACNALSSVLPEYQNTSGIAITGVIAPAARFLKTAGYSLPAVIGGKRTIRSRAYLHEMDAPGQRLVQRIAQPLSAFIEAGDIHSRQFHKSLETILRPLKKCDGLVLGCTHYIAAVAPIKKYLDVPLVDPARLLLEWIDANWSLPHSASQDIFVTTGDPGEMIHSAQSMFGVSIDCAYKAGFDR